MPIESEVLGKRSPCSSRRVWRGALVSQQPFCLVSHWHCPPPHTHPLLSMMYLLMQRGCSAHDWPKRATSVSLKESISWSRKYLNFQVISKSVTQLPCINLNLKTLCTSEHDRKEQSRPEHFPKGQSLRGGGDSLPPPRFSQESSTEASGVYSGGKVTRVPPL